MHNKQQVFHFFSTIMDLLSVRNKQKFHHEGYMYLFDKFTANNERKMWRCEQKNLGCKARLPMLKQAKSFVSGKSYSPQ